MAAAGFMELDQLVPGERRYRCKYGGSIITVTDGDTSVLTDCTQPDGVDLTDFS